MLIVDAFRILLRTFRALFYQRKSSTPPNTARARLLARTGYFSNPTSAGMITGAVAAGLSLFATIYTMATLFTPPPVVFFATFLTCLVLCSGPYVVTFSAKGLMSTVWLSGLLAVAASLPFCLVQMSYKSFVFVYLHYYLIDALLKLVACLLIGRHLARNYCAPKSARRAALMAVAGNLPIFAHHSYFIWIMEFTAKRRPELPREYFAFLVMAYVISQIGTAALPAWAAEKEFRENVTVPGTPASLPPAATVPPAPAPVRE